MTPSSSSRFAAYAWALSEKGPRHRFAVIDQVDPCPCDVEIPVALGHHVVDQIGDRPGRLHPRGPCSDHDHVQRTLVDARGVGVSVLEGLEQAGAQSVGIGHRVEREGVLLRAGRVEEVGPRACGEHEVVAAESLAVARRDSPARDVDTGDLGEFHRDAGVRCEDPPKGPGDVDHGQLGRGHLVQQRLELVVVVPIDDRHRDVVLGEFGGATHSGEAAADDHDRRLLGLNVLHGHVLRRPVPAVITRSGGHRGG